MIGLRANLRPSVSLNSCWLLAYKTATAKYSIVHQIDKAHVAFIKRIMTGRCTGLLRLLAELSVHSEPLFENDTPIAG